jgi:hypothetical protein
MNLLQHSAVPSGLSWGFFRSLLGKRNARSVMEGVPLQDPAHFVHFSPGIAGTQC